MTSLLAIRTAVAKAYKLDPALLQSGSTGRAVVEARYAGIYLARAHTDASLEAIGRRFGRRGHVNTLDALARAEIRRKRDAVFRYRVATIGRALTAAAPEPIEGPYGMRPATRRPFREPVAALLAADDAIALAHGAEAKADARSAFKAALADLRAVFENSPEAQP